MTVRPVPEGYATVTPYLVVGDLERLLAFVQEAFGAEVLEHGTLEDGTPLHAEVRIGDSRVMMGQEREAWRSSRAHLYLYLPGVDEVYARALAAGGEKVQEPADQFYGDRTAAVLDPCGVSWWIATHVEDVPPEELAARAQAARG